MGLGDKVFSTVDSAREQVRSCSETQRNDGLQATSAFNRITTHHLLRFLVVASFTTGLLKGEQIQLSENDTKETTQHVEKCLAA